MNDLTFAIRDCRLISYADDTKLYLSHPDPQAVEDGLNRDLTNTTMWFQQNGMVANPDKYQALVLGNTTHDFDIKNKEEPIPVSSEIQLLGVTLDNKLKFDSHIASICRKVAGQVKLRMSCLAKPRKHYIVLSFFLTLFIVVRYGTIVGLGTLRN